jgi:hypothetical protein
MKIKILLGVLISIFAMSMLPSISAIQINKIFEESQVIRNNNIKQNNYQLIILNIKNRIKNIDPEPQLIGILSLILGLIIGILSDFTVGISIAILGFIFGTLLSITKLFTKITILFVVIVAMIIIGLRVMELEEPDI